MTTYYAVHCAPNKTFMDSCDSKDYMIRGGIYTDLNHARARATSLIKASSYVWIEEHVEKTGWIDTVTKETRVATHLVQDD